MQVTVCPHCTAQWGCELSKRDAKLVQHLCEGLLDLCEGMCSLQEKLSYCTALKSHYFPNGVHLCTCMVLCSNSPYFVYSWCDIDKLHVYCISRSQWTSPHWGRGSWRCWGSSTTFVSMAPSREGPPPPSQAPPPRPISSVCRSTAGSLSTRYGLLRKVIGGGRGLVHGKSFSRTNDFVNPPSLVLKARHIGGSAFCNFDRLGVPE